MIYRTVQCSRNVLHAVQPQSRVPCGVWQGKDMTAVVLQAENYARKVRALAAGGLRVPFSATRAHKHWHPHGKRKPESAPVPLVCLAGSAREPAHGDARRGYDVTAMRGGAAVPARQGRRGIGRAGRPDGVRPQPPSCGPSPVIHPPPDLALTGPGRLPRQDAGRPV